MSADQTRSTPEEPEESQAEAADAVESAASSEGNAIDEAFSTDPALQAALMERDQYYDNWLRAQAELENFRKRTQKEMQQNFRYQAISLARDLLPALDNLERALAAAQESANIQELTQGVQMVAQQLQDILGQHDVKPIEALDQPFDPNLHEAIQQMPSANHPPMTVMHEVERGYLLHDRVVRPSKVIVSGGSPEE